MENEAGEVIHRGIVTRVDGDTVTVRIGSGADQCSGCAIAGLCSKPTEITADVPEAASSLVGRTVEVRATGRVQAAARVMLMLVPLVLVLTALLVGSLLGWADWASGLSAVVLLALWFGFLYLRRGHLRREIRFHISEIE